MTPQELERLGKQYLSDNKTKQEKTSFDFSSISTSSRPTWIKGFACALLNAGEAAITAATVAVEIKREVQHQRYIRAGKRLVADMENNGYITNDTQSENATKE